MPTNLPEGGASAPVLLDGCGEGREGRRREKREKKGRRHNGDSTFKNDGDRLSGVFVPRASCRLY